MIYWKDFILDEIGAFLDFREGRLVSRGVMDDSRSTIQETGQEQRPARMVGPTSLVSVQTDKEVDRLELAKDARNGGEV